MHSAPRSAASTRPWSTKPGTATASVRPCVAYEREHAPALGPVAVDLRPQLRRLGARQRQRGHERGHALLRDVAAGEDHQGRVDIRLDSTLSLAARVLALQHGHLAPDALAAQPRRVQPREAERPLRDARARPLHPPADPAAGAPEVVAPVRARPQLVPVDHEPEAPPAPHETGREQGEVGEGGGVDDVVAPAAPREVREHAEPEHERRPDPPPARRACRGRAAGRPSPRARPARRGRRRAATGAASGT